MEYIDKGKFVIVFDGKARAVKVRYLKRTEQRYFVHKNIRYLLKVMGTS